MNYASVVKSFYLAYYGRPADAAGLAFWTLQLERADGDFGAIASAFSSSLEAQARFGASDATARITQIYQQLFDRAPEQAGLDFWLQALENGSVTIADIAVQIMGGAQGSDADLSDLRQQAADQFTAEISRSGAAYDGMAATAAARALVQSVKADASATELAALVKSAVALSDIATRSPAVIEALGAGAGLDALFSTARGKADPVALMQTLADVAKAAAGNASTLDSLLLGGGMAKVLASMPAGATLGDVVDALGRGGLSEAIDVVYPPKPDPAPVAGTLSFNTLEGGGGGTLPATNNVAQLALKLQGNDAGTLVKYQMSPNGVVWLTQGNAAALADGTYYYRAVVTDAAGKSSTSNVIGAVLDRVAPVLSTLATDASDHQLALGETLTLRVKFSEVVKIAADAAPSIDLSNGGSAVYQSGTGTDTLVFSYQAAAGQDTTQLTAALAHALHGQIVDRAGNAVATAALDGVQFGPVSVDTQAPQQSLSVRGLEQRDGIGPDAGAGKALMTNLDMTTLHLTLSAALEAGERVDYSLDKGKTWHAAQVDADGLSVEVANIAAAGNPTVTLRVSDAAGNHGAEISREIGYDGAMPALGTITLLSITHDARDAAPDDTLTNAAMVDVQFGFTGTLADGVTLQYSIDGQHWIDASVGSDGHSVAIAGLQLGAGVPDGDGNLAQLVQLRALTASGNASVPTGMTLVYDGHADAPGVALADDTGASGVDRISSVATLSVTDTEAGAIVEYSLDGVTGWSEEAPGAVQGTNTVHVRQVDAAGNISQATPFTFTYDTQTPAKPGLALVADTGDGDADGITKDGRVLVSGLEHGNGSTWEYSLDGAHWQSGPQADNTGHATLTLSGNGQRDLHVRQADAAGNAGAEETLTFTLDTTAPPALSFLLVEGASAGTPAVTDLALAKVSFGFDGVLSASDSVQYCIGNGPWVSVSGSAGTVDADARTITLNDINLGAADPIVQVRIVDTAGNESSISQKIDGPYQDLQFTATATAAGLQVSSNAAGNAYLTGTDGVARAIVSTSGGGIVAGSATFGVQGAAAQGTLSAGPDAASSLANPGGAKYALGTNASETLTGQYVWGFGGHDTLVGTAGDDVMVGGADGQSVFKGGLGADSFTVQGNFNELVYASAAESHVVGGSGPAGGFDTVFTSGLGFAPGYNQLVVHTPVLMSAFSDIIDITPNGSAASLLAAFNSAPAASAPNVAMLFATSAQEHYLVVADGDGVIDANDYVVKIIGQIRDYGIDFDTNDVLIGIGYR